MSPSGNRRIDWDAVRRRLAAVAAEAGADNARQVLVERARELARVPPVARPGLERTVITFEVADERYAVETACVIEVCRLADMTPLPGAPTHAAGVINLRGEILIVFDLRPLIGRAVARPTPASRALVLGGGRAEFGLIADSADEVRGLPAEDVFPAAGQTRQGWLLGVTADGTAVLDGAALLADPRFLVG